MKKRKIAMVMNFASYNEAEQNDDLYYSKLTAEELLKECFDLRKINYFNGCHKNLPRIKKVGKIVIRQNYEKQNA